MNELERMLQRQMHLAQTLAADATELVPESVDLTAPAGSDSAAALHTAETLAAQLSRGTQLLQVLPVLRQLRQMPTTSSDGLGAARQETQVPFLELEPAAPVRQAGMDSMLAVSRYFERDARRYGE